MDKGDVLKTAVVLASTIALAAGCFNVETKKEIVERDGYICRDCGSTENLTFHHVVPEFFLKRQGVDPNQSKFGVCVCRSCHDKRDEELLPRYGINVRRRRHERRSNYGT